MNVKSFIEEMVYVDNHLTSTEQALSKDLIDTVEGAIYKEISEITSDDYTNIESELENKLSEQLEAFVDHCRRYDLMEELKRIVLAEI